MTKRLKQKKGLLCNAPAPTFDLPFKLQVDTSVPGA